MPTLVPRHRATASSLLALSSWLPKMMRPLDGRSGPVSMLRTVDLPLPEGPLMAKRLPAGTAKVTSSRIRVVLALLVEVPAQVFDLNQRRHCSGSVDRLDRSASTAKAV